MAGAIHLSLEKGEGRGRGSATALSALGNLICIGAFLVVTGVSPKVAKMRGLEPASSNTNPTLVGGSFQNQANVLLFSSAWCQSSAMGRAPSLREALSPLLGQGTASKTLLVPCAYLFFSRLTEPQRSADRLCLVQRLAVAQTEILPDLILRAFRWLAMRARMDETRASFRPWRQSSEH